MGKRRTRHDARKKYFNLIFNYINRMHFLSPDPHAPCSMLHALCSILHALCPLPHAPGRESCVINFVP